MAYTTKQVTRQVARELVADEVADAVEDRRIESEYADWLLFEEAMAA